VDWPSATPASSRQTKPSRSILKGFLQEVTD
jgi:hypothetical protein